MKLVCDYMIKNRNEYEYLENGGIYIYVPETVIVKTVRTGMICLFLEISGGKHTTGTEIR